MRTLDPMILKEESFQTGGQGEAEGGTVHRYVLLPCRNEKAASFIAHRIDCLEFMMSSSSPSASGLTYCKVVQQNRKLEFSSVCPLANYLEIYEILL